MCDYVVGIDFGIHNSHVAICRNDEVEILADETGSKNIPSWVGFSEDEILVGNDAKREFHKNLRSTIFEVKRLIGKKYNDPEVQEELLRLPYVVINESGLPKIHIVQHHYNYDYYPEEITAFIIGKLKEIAEEHLNDAVTKSVLTVPVYFSDLQKQLLKEAATAAGFNSTVIINEPTAVALAFDHKSGKNYDRHVLVYSFARTAFDVSVVSFQGGKCEIKSTKRDPELGGRNIDQNLIQLIKEDFKEQYGKYIHDQLNTQRVQLQCKSAKKALSIKHQSVLDIDPLLGENYTFMLSRNKFEEINQAIFEKTLQLVEECIQESGLKREDIDEVLLNGGSSRIPRVQKMLEDCFGKGKINKTINPEEAVAYGAAIYAQTLKNDDCAPTLPHETSKLSKSEGQSIVTSNRRELVSTKLCKEIVALEALLNETRSCVRKSKYGEVGEAYQLLDKATEIWTNAGTKMEALKKLLAIKGAEV